MAFYLVLLGVLLIANLAAVILVILISLRNRRKSVKGNALQQDKLSDEEQAAVTASTWTSLNPPT